MDEAGGGASLWLLCDAHDSDGALFNGLRAVLLGYRSMAAIVNRDSYVNGRIDWNINSDQKR